MIATKTFTNRLNLVKQLLHSKSYLQLLHSKSYIQLLHSKSYVQLHHKILFTTQNRIYNYLQRDAEVNSDYQLPSHSHFMSYWWEDLRRV